MGGGVATVTTVVGAGESAARRDRTTTGLDAGAVVGAAAVSTAPIRDAAARGLRTETRSVVDGRLAMRTTSTRPAAMTETTHHGKAPGRSESRPIEPASSQAAIMRIKRIALLRRIRTVGAGNDGSKKMPGRAEFRVDPERLRQQPSCSPPLADPRGVQAHAHQPERFRAWMSCEPRRMLFEHHVSVLQAPARAGARADNRRALGTTTRRASSSRPDTAAPGEATTRHLRMPRSVRRTAGPGRARRWSPRGEG